MSDDYKPIDCGRHDQLELAIMHKDSLRVVWCDERNIKHVEVIRPKDLRVRDHVEYLVYDNAAGEHQLRLDRLLQFDIQD